MGIYEATYYNYYNYYNWKQKYGELGVSELRPLKQLEEKKRQFKKLVADLSLGKQRFQDTLSKKLCGQPKRSNLLTNFGLSSRGKRVCQVVGLWCAVYYYKSGGVTVH